MSSDCFLSSAQLAAIVQGSVHSRLSSRMVLFYFFSMYFIFALCILDDLLCFGSLSSFQARAVMAKCLVPGKAVCTLTIIVPLYAQVGHYPVRSQVLEANSTQNQRDVHSYSCSFSLFFFFIRIIGLSALTSCSPK